MKSFGLIEVNILQGVEQIETANPATDGKTKNQRGECQRAGYRNPSPNRSQAQAEA